MSEMRRENGSFVGKRMERRSRARESEGRERRGKGRKVCESWHFEIEKSERRREARKEVRFSDSEVCEGVRKFHRIVYVIRV